MPEKIWTASLHIQNGETTENAPEIAHAERTDGQNGSVALYLLAEPDRTGSEQFIEDLVNRIGEDFLAEKGSLTGDLQRVLIERHEELFDWNRTSLPRDQATYGISCLIIRDENLFLAQVGPSLIFFRDDDKILQRRPTTQRAIPPLGATQVVIPEFSQMTLGNHRWMLLISSAAAAVLNDEIISALQSLEAQDVLPAIYPMLLRLPRASALVVAMENTTSKSITAPDFSDSEENQSTPIDHQSSNVNESLENIQLYNSKKERFLSAVSGISTFLEQWRPHKKRITDPDQEVTQEFSSLTKEHKLKNEPDIDFETEVDFKQEPKSTTDKSDQPEQRHLDHSSKHSLLDAEGTAKETQDKTEIPDLEDAEDNKNTQTTEINESVSVDTDSSPKSRSDLDASDKTVVSPLPSTSQSSTTEWPENPFTPSPPLLSSDATEIDSSRIANPLIQLRNKMPNFQRRNHKKISQNSSAQDFKTIGRFQWYTSLWVKLSAISLVFAVIAGILLIPDTLQDSERNRFDEALYESRRSLTAATLATDSDTGKYELTAAMTAVKDALSLRPMNPEALELLNEIDLALLQANAVIQPADLTILANLHDSLNPPLALANVQVGPEMVFLLDESGSRIVSLSLTGSDPMEIFSAGQRYQTINQFSGPVSSNPIAMQWSENKIGSQLVILDSNGQLFQYNPDTGVDALPNPMPEIFGSVNGVAVSKEQIYILDVAGGTVWRLEMRTDGSIGHPEAAIERTNLGDASSLVVSTDILIAGTDGRIRRFSLDTQQKGQEIGFPIPKLDQPLLIPASLTIGSQTKLIYAVDRGNNRVVIFSPGGDLIAQFRADMLDGVRGIVTDEKNRLAYYVTIDSLISSALPELGIR